MLLAVLEQEQLRSSPIFLLLQNLWHDLKSLERTLGPNIICTGVDIHTELNTITFPWANGKYFIFYPTHAHTNAMQNPPVPEAPQLQLNFADQFVLSHLAPSSKGPYL